MRAWQYGSADLSGGLHETAAWLTKVHPEWDVVTVHCERDSSSRVTTTVLYRTEKRNGNGRTARAA